jgi:hypothetical protein
MGRPYLLAMVASGAIIQCYRFTNAGSTETDRAALERADQSIGWHGAPDPEIFAHSITDVRNRFGDTAAGVLIDRVLAREPCYAPAHLARAESLFRHGRHEGAVVEGNLALRCSNRNSSRAPFAFDPHSPVPGLSAYRGTTQGMGARSMAGGESLRACCEPLRDFTDDPSTQPSRTRT